MSTHLDALREAIYREDTLACARILSRTQEDMVWSYARDHNAAPVDWHHVDRLLWAYVPPSTTIPPLWVRRTPVTREEWSTLMDTPPPKDPPHAPAHSLSWYQSLELCNRLSLQQYQQATFRFGFHCPYHRNFEVESFQSSCPQCEKLHLPSQNVLFTTPRHIRVAHANTFRLPTFEEWSHFAGENAPECPTCLGAGNLCSHCDRPWNGDECRYCNERISYTCTTCNGSTHDPLTNVLKWSDQRPSHTSPNRPNKFGLYHTWSQVFEWCLDSPRADPRTAIYLRGGSPKELHAPPSMKSPKIGCRPVRRAYLPTDTSFQPERDKAPS